MWGFRGVLLRLICTLAILYVVGVAALWYNHGAAQGGVRPPTCGPGVEGPCPAFCVPTTAVNLRRPDVNVL